MSDIQTIVTQETIQNQIFTIRGKQVMLDRDLAKIYGVDTRVVNQAVKRNLERFPQDFMFELTRAELASLRSQTVILEKKGAHSKYLPTVFSQEGIAMIASVLKSESAITISVQIMRAFVEMRKFLKDNVDVFVRLENVERNQSLLQCDTNRKFDQVFNALQNNNLEPKQGIFYDGQVFDAYTFIADLIRDAKYSIVLIDNYIDDTVFRLFTKRNKSVSFMIYTKTISPQLSLDLQKHNEQYPPVIIKTFSHAHDRFLIVDENTVYHIGASLKDLGKKWFAFSKIEIGALDMLKRLI